MSPQSSSIASNFADDCRNAVVGLREALRDLYRDAGADPERPQDVARRFGLNKNLTWKISRLLQTVDSFDAVPLIPGSEGIGILLQAFGARGASAPALERVRAASAEFDRLIKTHSGDRATLELLVDVRAGARSLEMSRRLAFRGNSGVWGLQAHGRVVTQVFAPNAARPDMLDQVLATGIIDLRRLRPIHRWPLFRFIGYDDDALRKSLPESVEALEPAPAVAGEPHDPLWLMPSWCSPRHPPIASCTVDGQVIHELCDGPLGRTGQATMFFGFLERRAVPRYGDAHNRLGEAGVFITTPVECLVFDLIVHRSLTEALAPEACIFGMPSGEQFRTTAERERLRLPIVEVTTTMSATSPQIATPLVPHYDRLLATMFARGGWDARDFTVTRLELDYPPMPSMAVLRYPLPPRPGAEHESAGTGGGPHG